MGCSENTSDSLIHIRSDWIKTPDRVGVVDKDGYLAGCGDDFLDTLAVAVEEILTDDGVVLVADFGLLVLGVVDENSVFRINSMSSMSVTQ